MKNRIASILLVLLALSISAYSQTERENVAPTPGTAVRQTDKATVHFYRYKQYMGSALEPAIYCDDKVIAKMDNGTYFLAVLEPGKHILQSNDKQSGIELDMKPGEEYFVRVEIATGFWKGHGRLVMVPKEQGSFEIKKLKPLQKKKIVDNSIASSEDESLSPKN
jgi:hypothetical protein